MPDALEASLARALRQAAEAAPEPAADAGEALLRERDRRNRFQAGHRNHLLAAAAAITVLIVLVAAVSALKLFRGGEDTRPLTKPVKIVHTEYDNGAPLAQVWPDALRTLPATVSADNQQYGFDAVRPLPNGRILVQLVGDDQKAGQLWSMDPATDKAEQVSPDDQRVVLVAQPAGDQNYERWVVWAAVKSDANSGNAPVYLWYAPIRGGKAHQLMSKEFTTQAATDAGSFQLALAGETLAISKPKGQVSTLTVGQDHTIHTLRDSSHLTTLQWPWLTDLRTPGNLTIRNATTGEERQATLPANWTDVTCSVTWCLGRGGGRLMVTHRDGAEPRTVTDQSGGFSIYQDRFVFVTGSKVAYDLLAKKSFTLPRVVGVSTTTWHFDGVINQAGSNSPLFSWARLDKSGVPVSYLTIDLGKMS